MNTNELKSDIQEIFLFGVNFFKNPRRNGSLIPSSPFATEAILNGLDFSSIKTIVELGPGTGVFTEEIVRRARPDTKIILVELEKTYLPMLHERFGDRVIVENESAHLLDEIAAKHNLEKIDIIISSVPFLTDEIRAPFIEALKKQTGKGTILRFFTFVPPIAKQVYKDLRIQKKNFVLKNFPPLWVYGVN